MQTPFDFLAYLNEKQIPVTLRQGIIPTVNEHDENILLLREIIKNHLCIDKTELLPFCKICQTKYDNMQILFPFGNLPAPNGETMKRLNDLLQ